jgi:general secretion pathway protein J
VLARREQNRIDENPQRGGHIEVLARDVRELDFEFLDPQTMEWVSEWNAAPDSGAQANRLPMQVKIAVTVADPHDPDEDQTFVVRTWVPITWALNHATYNP